MAVILVVGRSTNAGVADEHKRFEIALQAIQHIDKFVEKADGDS